MVGRRRLTVGLSACVGPGDRLLLKKNGHVLASCVNGFARIFPPYRARDRMRCGAETIRITVKEITSEEEYKGYRQLLDFHYRGHAFRGRHAILVAIAHDPFYPHVLGYVELTTSFFMNKARGRVFNAPFDSKTGIRWKEWNANVAQRNINSVIRIARCVVYPEFRGLGLGQILINHSFRFAKSHWHVGRVRPCFVEITADMLKFIPFAARAGMVFIGRTEGNLGRVRKDLEYLLRNKSRISEGEIIRVKDGANWTDPQGILDLQLGYMRQVQTILRDNGLKRKSFLAHLEDIDEHLPLKTYALLHKVLRFPKPTYMKGLTRTAHEFLLRRVRQLEIDEPGEISGTCGRPLTTPITIDNLQVAFSTAVRLTRKTQAIQQAFGLSLNQLECTVLKNFSLQVPPASIVLLYGASGSGKTILLDLIARRGRPRRTMSVSGTIAVPEGARIGVFKPIASTRPLIEVFGGRDVYKAIHVLNTAGLSEAYLYLKRFGDLSRGQQYRALIAKMVESDANLWLADEFCATLDPVTANIVSSNVRRHAKKIGATLIVACADCADFASSLQPDIVVQLTNAWEYQVFQGERFLQVLEQRRVRSLPGIR